MRHKMNALYMGAKNKVTGFMNRKDAGIEGIMVVALLCVIAVALTAQFKTEASGLIDQLFSDINTNITELFKEVTGS